MKMQYVVEVVFTHKDFIGVHKSMWTLAGTIEEAVNNAWLWFDRTQDSSRDFFEINYTRTCLKGFIDG